MTSNATFLNYGARTESLYVTSYAQAEGYHCFDSAESFLESVEKKVSCSVRVTGEVWEILASVQSPMAALYRYLLDDWANGTK